MDQSDNFEIKYWSEDFNNLNLNPQKQKRSTGKKLLMVLLFTGILAVLPVLILGLGNFKSNTPKIATVSEVKTEPTKSSGKKSVEQKSTDESKVKVINNDSYWKISKRICGTGKYYLSIRDQNLGKALFLGDEVKVNCDL